MKYVKIVLKVTGIICFSVFLVLVILDLANDPYYSGPENGTGEVPDIRTKKEIKFCDSLENIGYKNVKLKILYHVNRQGEIKMPHWLYYEKENPFNCTQEDSINNNSVQLLSELIANYTEDSAIYYGEFLVCCNDVSDYNNELYKWQIEKIVGFKVLKIGKNRFKRITIKNELKPMRLFIPESWKGKKGLCKKK